jgi:glycine C-acetyltransferase
VGRLGLTVKAGEHPIVPMMLGDARIAQDFAATMLEKGVYVVGFAYPVVPLGQARIRVQVSAVDTRKDLEFALDAFDAVVNGLVSSARFN